MKVHEKILLIVFIIFLSFLFISALGFFIFFGGGSSGGMAVIVQESVKKKNEFIFHSFNARAINFYYAELMGKKNNNLNPQVINGEIIILDDSNRKIIYEKKFEFSLIKKKTYIYNKYLYDSFTSERGFFMLRRYDSKWYIDAFDKPQDLVYFPDKKCKLIIKFNHTPPSNAFLYGWIHEGIGRKAESHFELTEPDK